MVLYEDRVNLNVLGQISFLFLHFLLFLIVSKFDGLVKSQKYSLSLHGRGLG